MCSQFVGNKSHRPSLKFPHGIVFLSSFTIFFLSLCCLYGTTTAWSYFQFIVLYVKHLLYMRQIIYLISLTAHEWFQKSDPHLYAKWCFYQWVCLSVCLLCIDPVNGDVNHTNTHIQGINLHPHQLPWGINRGHSCVCVCVWLCTCVNVCVYQ